MAWHCSASRTAHHVRCSTCTPLSTRMAVDCLPYTTRRAQHRNTCHSNTAMREANTSCSRLPISARLRKPGVERTAENRPGLLHTGHNVHVCVTQAHSRVPWTRLDGEWEVVVSTSGDEYQWRLLGLPATEHRPPLRSEPNAEDGFEAAEQRQEARSASVTTGLGVARPCLGMLATRQAGRDRI